MTSGGKLWWVTRPTRDLHDLKIALVDFVRLAKGKKWWGNRSLQKQFESQNRAKTSNAGLYGSGGRTWAALLRMWGLWYDDQHVTITSAGDVLLSCKNVYEQMFRLIMNFQITSAYSEHQKLEPGFKIFPFRFILKLLLDERIKYLEEDEIALFVLQVKTPSEYEKTAQKILKHRKLRKKDGVELRDRTELIKDHMIKYRTTGRKDTPKSVEGHWKYIKDVANTLVNNIRYLHDIKYDESSGTIRIIKEKKKAIKEILEEYEKEHQFSTLYRFGEKPFAEHFGLRFDRRKASKKDTRAQTAGRKRLSRIKAALEEITKTKSNLTATEAVKLVKDATGYHEDEIEKIISENPEIYLSKQQNLDPSFVEYYLVC